MALASYRSTETQLSELEAAYSDDKSSQDLCLIFLQKSSKRTLLTVGGRWLTPPGEEPHWQEPPPPDIKAVIIAVNDNQVPTVEAFARHLRARIEGTPRKPFLITGGNRRGGKSWIVTALALAAAIAIPGAIVWMVSPILDKREELERYLKGHAAAGWLKPTVREFKFTLPHGSVIKNITGEDDEALKRGEADLVVYNEPQLMSIGVLVYGAPAVIDQGGLVLFAGNPAQKKKGVWFTRLWKAVESGKYPHAEVYWLDKKDNPDIDRQTDRQMGELLALVSPSAARADDEGLFLEPGNFPYAEHFDERRNSCPSFPDLVHPITGEVVRLRGQYDKRDRIGGVDFQANYGNAGVEVVAVGDKTRPTFYVTSCLVREGDESYFLDDAFEMWERERMLWIGDPSGAWQDAPHTESGFRGRDSFTKFQARKWKILPPREKQSDRGKFAAHPPVTDNINLVNLLLEEGRLIICMDKAALVAEALQKCEYGKTSKTEWRPAGPWAHLTDALRYVLYWLTPRPTRQGVVPNKHDMIAVTLSGQGPRIL